MENNWTFLLKATAAKACAGVVFFAGRYIGLW